MTKIFTIGFQRDKSNPYNIRTKESLLFYILMFSGEGDANWTEKSRSKFSEGIQQAKGRSEIRGSQSKIRSFSLQCCINTNLVKGKKKKMTKWVFVN